MLMRLPACLLILGTLCGGLHLASAADDEFQIAEGGDHTVKVLIGDDVFTTFYHGLDRRKPFFFPAAVEGSWELLQQAAPDGDGPARNLIVCGEKVALRTQDGSTTTGKVVDYGTVLRGGEIHGNWIDVPELKGWINRQDVIPESAAVTRVIRDNPPRIKDVRSPDYYDHPHHKGIWLSVDEVNGIKFWNEDGVIQNVEMSATVEGPRATFHLVNHWLNEQSAPLLIETTNVTISPQRLMTFDVTFTAAEEPVTFGDTKEGMLAIRLPNSMREMISGGPVTDADGREGTKAIWGRTSNWVNYVGQVGHHSLAVTLMDHPGNPRPGRYHVRDYGLFAINPFGQAAYTADKETPLEADEPHLAPGESIRFQYGLWIHQADEEGETPATMYQQFLDQTATPAKVD